MAKKDINAPVEGDDIGNLLKAGDAANELPLAKKIYAQEIEKLSNFLKKTCRFGRRSSRRS
jgi:hypothetical protein